MRYLLTILLFSALNLGGYAQTGEWDVLDDEHQGHPTHLMLQKYMENLAKPMHEARQTRIEALKTPREIKKYQSKMKAFFEKQLGGFPERTPLNAEVVGKGEGAGIRYEKIIFESQPGFFVTGILYLPIADGPFPAVIMPCGHSANGKAAETYQRASFSLALNGIAAFCYDPIGQGERYHYIDKDGKPTLGATVEHTLLGVGCILTGTNIAMYRIWDGMRALDYLESRPDIDSERLGCTGNSGGGTLTSYIMALDPRVKVAAPSCYITNFERLLATIGPQDAEQDIFGQIAFGMDHADYIHMRAPKPTLICAATQDFFDIEGTRATYQEAKKIYTALGHAERLAFVEADEKHGFTKPLREAMTNWMCKWLLEKEVKFSEPDFQIFTDNDLQCTPNGQVLLMEGARSVVDLNVARAESLRKNRQELDRKSLKRIIAGNSDVYDDISMMLPHKKQVVETLEKDDRLITKLLLSIETGVDSPAYTIENEQIPDANILILNGEGQGVEFEKGGRAWNFSRYAVRVMLADLRGIGETENDQNHHGWIGTVGPDWQDYFYAYLLGESIVNMRTRDVLCIANYLHEESKGELPLHVIATGEKVVPVLHAAALAPHLFESIEIIGGIPSWEEVVRTSNARDQLVNSIHGVLEHYDLPDLIELIGADKVKISESKVPTF